MATKLELTDQIKVLERQLDEAKAIIAKVREFVVEPPVDAHGYAGKVGAIRAWVTTLCPRHLR